MQPSLGYKVIPRGDDVRFWNNDVLKDIDGVILAIIRAMEDASVKIELLPGNA